MGTGSRASRELFSAGRQPGAVACSEDAAQNSRRIFRNELNGLDAWSRHKYIVDTYLRVYSGTKEKLDAQRKEAEKEYRTEFDVLKGNHQFLRKPDEDERDLTWEQRVAKKYYDKLFKEYCIADLKYFNEGKIALRWRTHSEAVGGKGQFVCGALHCEEQQDLHSWEVNFAYVEGGERKNALVKVRLCPDCSDKLHYSRGGKDSTFDDKGGQPRKEGGRGRKGRRGRSPLSGEDESENDDREHFKRRHKSSRRHDGDDESGGTEIDSEDGLRKKRRRRKSADAPEEGSHVDVDGAKRRLSRHHGRSGDDRGEGRRRRSRDRLQTGKHRRSRSPTEKMRSQEEITTDVDRFLADLFK